MEQDKQTIREEGKALTAITVKEFQKELSAANDTIATLRESVRGKLVLEEQMASLMKRYVFTNCSCKVCNNCYF